MHGPRVMSPCPKVTTSATLLGSSGEGKGARHPRGRPSLGLAPRILTPSPVTGWQDVGKPTSPYFNTASYVTSRFPHAAAQERVTVMSACLAIWPHEGEAGLGLPPRLSSPRHPSTRVTALVLKDTRPGWGRFKGARRPTACSPCFWARCRPVSRGTKPNTGQQALLRVPEPGHWRGDSSLRTSGAPQDRERSAESPCP